MNAKGTQGLIFVIDSSDRDRIDEARQELHRIIQDREMSLFDGTRLIRMDRYQYMLTRLSKEELDNKKIFPIHLLLLLTKNKNSHV